MRKLIASSQNKMDIAYPSKQEQRGEEIIFQLPELVWRQIGRILTYPPKDLYNISLASPRFDTLLDVASLRNCKFGVIGKRVFSILVGSFYLDREDLLNCVKTNSDNLGMFAACSWRFQQSPTLQEVELPKHASISTLYTKIKNEKRNGKIWSLFAGKRFHLNFQKYFNSPSLDIESVSELFRTYGRYFVDIRLSQNCSLSYNEAATIQILLMLFHGNLPNLQRMYVDYKGLEGIYALTEEFQSSRTLETISRLGTFLCTAREGKTQFFQIVSRFAQAWTMSRSNSGVGFDKLTKWSLGSLLYVLKKGNWSQQLLLGQRENLAQIKSLTLPSCSSPTESLSFAVNFPNLSEVTINVHDLAVDGQFHRLPKSFLVIPQVRTLTFVWSTWCPLLHLSAMLSIFSRMNYLRLKTFFSKSDFASLIKLHLEGDNINRNTTATSSSMSAGSEEMDVDIYHLICTDQSLAKSNVWHRFPPLNVLSIQTGESRNLQMKYFLATERYERITNGNVKLEKYYQTKFAGQ